MKRLEAADLNGRTRALTVLALLLCGALLTGPVAAQEKTDVGAAKDAVALLLDNQKRCTIIADGQLLLLEGRETHAQREASIDRYLYRKARIDIDAARKSLDIVYRLTSTFGIEVSEAAYASVADMLHAQEGLYGLASYSSHFRAASEYKQLAKREASKFQTAFQSMPRQFVPNSGERRAALRRYRDEIFESSSVDPSDSDTRISSGPGAPVESRAYTTEEYADRKEVYDAWLAEQERRQEELLKRQAAQREQRRKRQEATAERELPKVTLKAPEPSQSSEPTRPLVPLEDMQAWHADYAVKIVPVKAALGSYLKYESPVPSEFTRQICRDLARTLDNYLEDESVTNPPDEIVSKTLGTAFREFKNAADACILGRLAKAKDHVAGGRKALGQATAALKDYSLGL
ncbi:MAG: hypothetical protein GY719_33725 [bacterium]|nr:hypothetical protein [bacterium]